MNRIIELFKNYLPELAKMKDFLEIIYYIAFIILTILLVIYARKTYLFQSKLDSTLFCKLFVPTSEFKTSAQIICLEIYNNGNAVANSVLVKLADRELAIIDYIKPHESVSLPIGELKKMIEINRVWIQDTQISETDTLSISLTVNGINTSYTLNPSILFVRSDVSHNESASIAQSLKDINTTLGKAFDCHQSGPSHRTFRDELCKIADIISKGKK